MANLLAARIAWTNADNALQTLPSRDFGRRRYHIPVMTTFLTILLVLALLGVLGILGMGVVAMVRGGDPRRSNKLMQSRVAMQALALVLLALLMMLVGRR